MRFIFNQPGFSKNSAGHWPSESTAGRPWRRRRCRKKDKLKLANLMSLAINFYPAHLREKEKSHLWKLMTVEDGLPGAAAGGLVAGGVSGEQQTAESQRR